MEELNLDSRNKEIIGDFKTYLKENMITNFTEQFKIYNNHLVFVNMIILTYSKEDAYKYNDFCKGLTSIVDEVLDEVDFSSLVMGQKEMVELLMKYKSDEEKMGEIFMNMSTNRATEISKEFQRTYMTKIISNKVKKLSKEEIYKLVTLYFNKDVNAVATKIQLS